MSKILAIDYGLVRSGLAITDSMRIIASPLQTVPTRELMVFLSKLFAKEDIEIIVVGEARRLNGEASEITKAQAEFVNVLQKKFPSKKIARIDEMYTSRMAAQSLVQSGMKKSDRQKKENLDMVSAAIILQSYLEKL